MPDHVITLSTLAWAIPGIAAAAALLLLGVDFARSRRTGARPRRRLVAAALLLLVGLAVVASISEFITWMRPVPRRFMCYFVGSLDPESRSAAQRLARLSQRLLLLERLIDEGRLSQATARQALRSARSELDATTRSLPDPLHPASAESCQQIERTLAGLERRTGQAG